MKNNELPPLTEEEKEKIRAKKREYNNSYYRKHKKEIAEKRKEWREQNPDKVKEINERHWRKKAGLKVQ